LNNKPKEQAYLSCSFSLFVYSPVSQLAKSIGWLFLGLLVQPNAQKHVIQEAKKAFSFQQTKGLMAAFRIQ
jgi:hypothetical protein